MSGSLDLHVAAVLTAAGSGTRLGSAEPKALVRLGGTPLVRHAHDRLRAAGVNELVITCPERSLDAVAAAVEDDWTRCVAGGSSRQASVAAGLESLSEHADVVLVHDAARPLASPALLSRLITAVTGGARAVIPVLPVADTVKRVREGTVVETLDRRDLVVVQTPQAFTLDLLTDVHVLGAFLAADESTAVSDDAGLVEQFSDDPVMVVAGEDRAMKITTAADLALAEAMLANGIWS